MEKNNLPKIIPIFPLSNFILFPKTSVPLNIFEPRYVEMINDSMKLDKLIGMIHQEGLTLVPTKLYFQKGKVKIQIAVGKGKKNYDKRQVKKNRDWSREKARIFSNSKK